MRTDDLNPSVRFKSGLGLGSLDFIAQLDIRAEFKCYIFNLDSNNNSNT